MNRISKNFWDHEVLDPDTYNNEKVRNTWFISDFYRKFPQFIRDRFDTPVFINTWKYRNPNVLGQVFNHSGFRPQNCNVGAALSQHRLLRAVDLKIPSLSIEEIVEDIKKNHVEYFEKTGLTTIEAGTKTWLHGDCRPTGLSGIYIVPFYKKEKK